MRSILFVNTINKTIDQGRLYKNSNIQYSIINDMDKFLKEFNKVYEKFIIIVGYYSNIIKITELKLNFSNISYYIKVIDKKLENNECDFNSLSVITSELKIIENELTTAWKEYIKIEISALEEIISSMENVIRSRPEKDKLDAILRKIKISKPGDPLGVKLITDYKIETNELLSKLNVNENVIKFFNLLSSKHRTVTIGDISEDVYNWLIDNGFEDRIKLEFR